MDSAHGGPRSRFRPLDAHAARVTATVLVFALVLALVWILRRVLLVVAFALFFAYLVSPLVDLAQRRLGLRHRTLAVGVVYVVLALVIVGAGFSLAPRLSREVTALTARIPAMTQQIRSGTALESLLGRYGWEGDWMRQLESAARTHAEEIIAYAQKGVTAILGWVLSAWVIVLVPIFAFFFLKDAEHVAAAVDELIEDPGRKRLWREIADDVHQLLGDYVRALILLSLITFVVWSVVFFLAGVPSAIVLAATGGALEFIPLVGPLVAAIVIVTVAVVSGFAHPWLLLLFIAVWRGIQDYGTSPLVMARGIELNPGLVIFGVIAGGEIAGPAGMFLSVPVIAALRVVWRRFQAYRRAPRIAA